MTNRIPLCLPVALLATVWLVTACGSGGMSMKEHVAANGSARHHVYDEITAFGSEISGYGLYTYVLFPQKSAAGSELARRYAELTWQIVNTTSSADEGLAAEWKREQSNIFYLPAGDEASRRILSLKLIEHLKRSAGDAADRLFPADARGPFLVSLPAPVVSLTGQTPMLVANLSATHIDAFPEVIAAYKKRLTESGVDRTARFESLRLSLLDLILKANENLSQVQVALAQWQQ